MKKEYVSPSVEMEVIEMESMIAASADIFETPATTEDGMEGNVRDILDGDFGNLSW